MYRIGISQLLIRRHFKVFGKVRLSETVRISKANQQGEETSQNMMLLWTSSHVTFIPAAPCRKLLSFHIIVRKSPWLPVEEACWLQDESHLPSLARECRDFYSYYTCKGDSSPAVSQQLKEKADPQPVPEAVLPWCKAHSTSSDHIRVSR